MLLKLYAIYDSKSLSYMPPYTVANDAMALRAFHQASLQPGTMPHDFPGDYFLFRIGNFDDETGAVGHEYPENLGPASQFNQPKAEVNNG